MSGRRGAPVRDAPRRPAPAPAATTAHPRIRARRVEVARSAGRRRLRRLNVVLAVVCAGVWALVVVRSPLLDVDRVQVSGSAHSDSEVVRGTAGVPTGRSLAEVDLGAVARRVEALPWVAEARVTRVWPGTLRVSVTERDPVAVVRHPEGWARVDARGRVLDVVDDRPSGSAALPGLRSVPPGDRLGPRDRSALRTLDALPAALAERAETVRLGDEGFEVLRRDGYLVVVGDRDQLAEKALAAETVIDEVVRTDTEGCRVDVRVPTAPVLTGGGTCA